LDSIGTGASLGSHFLGFGGIDFGLVGQRSDLLRGAIGKVIGKCRHTGTVLRTPNYTATASHPVGRVT
jgi:hypothetical protein